MSEKFKTLVLAPPVASSADEPTTSRQFLAGRYERMELRHLPFASHGRGLGKIFSLLGLIAAAGRERRKFKPHALYLEVFLNGRGPSAFEARLLSTLRKSFPATVLHFHGTGYAQLSPGDRRSFQKAFHHPALAIFDSHESLAEAADLEAERSAVVPPGLDDAWPKGLDPWQTEPPQILFHAPFTREHGLGTLLGACKILKSSRFKFRCVMTGPTTQSELAHWKREASELEGFVTFMEPVSGEAKQQLYQKSDIFCYPAYHETNARSVPVIEAMMAGLPIVTTKCGSLADVVVEGKTGFLMPPEDPKATANRLGRLLSNSILRQVMGTSSRNRFLENFSADIFRDRMEQAITSIQDAW